MVEEEFILNPDNDEAEKSILNLVVAGTEEAVTMVEGGAAECSEETLVEALKFAHTHIKKIIALQKKLQQLSGKPKREIISLNGDEEIQKAILNIIGGKIENALFLPKKLKGNKPLMNSLMNVCRT